MSKFGAVSAGSGAVLGAHPHDDGINFAVFSDNASRISVCLFDARGTETERFDLPERSGGVWHGHVAGLSAGQLYGLRADGDFDPARGVRFNHNKLLLDPYARQVTGHLEWNDALFGFSVGHHDSDLSFDPRDSAPYMPKCVATEPLPDLVGSAMQRPLAESVIYEAHVKGMTAGHPTAMPKGKFGGLASTPVLDHLTKLGVTAIELLPVHAFLDDHFLIEKSLRNYWGYQSLAFFAPDPRYLSGADIIEFRDMVGRFHAAGIEVLLDVVYNHTGEGTELGPTLSFRGLDNQSYYRLQDNARYYINDTGTGNTLNMDHPMVLRMVMDSLRYWVEVMGVDGFRFDLCSTLGRRADGFDPSGPFLTTIRQDPVLAQVKLIAEPWDIGPGGYQLGAFPHPFAEWNDRFRDTVRQFWRGDHGQAPAAANVVSGSAPVFDHAGRAVSSSVNFVAAHDGFTLNDLVAYNHKHNHANGEGNRDGHNNNHSDNLGVEGPTEDGGITAARDARKRAMLATVLLSQGTPMLLAGDELGNTQHGNNNAYCQDNPIGWVDWDHADETLLSFTRRLVGLRHAHPVLRQKLFLHAQDRPLDGAEDIVWWRTDGTRMTENDWHNPELACLCVEMRFAAETPAYMNTSDALFVVFNAGGAVEVILPTAPPNRIWRAELDTANPDGRPQRGALPEANPGINVAGQSVVMYALAEAI